MRMVEDDKLGYESHEMLVRIVEVLYGVWAFSNKILLENETFSAGVAMEFKPDSRMTGRKVYNMNQEWQKVDKQHD